MTLEYIMDHWNCLVTPIFKKVPKKMVGSTKVGGLKKTPTGSEKVSKISILAKISPTKFKSHVFSLFSKKHHFTLNENPDFFLKVRLQNSSKTTYPPPKTFLIICERFEFQKPRPFFHFPWKLRAKIQKGCAQCLRAQRAQDWIKGLGNKTCEPPGEQVLFT